MLTWIDGFGTAVGVPCVRPRQRGLGLYYASNGMLWRAVWETWSDDGEGGYDDHVKTAAVEFRYDSLRGRYLRRAVDPNDSYVPIETGTWTDYTGGGLGGTGVPPVGDVPYGDLTLTPGEGDTYDVVEETRYFGGMGEQTVSDGASRYYHADLVGSTTALTDEAGEVPTGGGAGPVRFAYTAFGEAVVYDTGESEWKVATTQPSGSPRYQYAGAHGYESDLLVLEGKSGTKPITLKHVGARWYQPGIGRFVQRDPIGIAGGLNCYDYARGNPSGRIDVFGLDATGADVDDYIREYKTRVSNNITDLKGNIARTLLDGPFRGFEIGVGPKVGWQEFGAALQFCVGFTLDKGMYANITLDIDFGPITVDIGYGVSEDHGRGPGGGGGAGIGGANVKLTDDGNTKIGCGGGIFSVGVEVRP